MENEITAHRDGVVTELSVGAGQSGPERPGDLRARPGGRGRLGNDRSAATSSRDNDEPLVGTASRIDHWLLVEYRGLWGPNAIRASGLSDQVKTHAPRAGRRSPTRAAALRAPPRPAWEARVPRVRGKLPRRRRVAPHRRVRVARGPPPHRPRHRGRPGRPAALPRLHARQARSLLRALRAATLRGARRAGRGGVRLAGDAHRRRPLRRQPRLPPARRLLRPRRARADRRRARQRTSPDRSSCPTTAAAPATRSPRRRPSETSASRRSCSPSTTCAWSEQDGERIVFEDSARPAPRASRAGRARPRRTT